MNPSQSIAIAAAQSTIAAAGQGVKTAVPWLEIVTVLLDALTGMLEGAAGVDLPNGDQIIAFATMVGGAAPAIGSSLAYDWWRADGWAGQSTLKILMPITELAGWPPSSQMAFAYVWFQMIAKLPGKGGGAGRSFWRAKLEDYKAGKPVTFYVQGLDKQKFVQLGSGTNPTQTTARKNRLPTGEDCAEGYVFSGGGCKRRLLAWNKGTVPAVIGGIPCDVDVGGVRCQAGTLQGRYLWNLTQSQVDQLNTGLYEALVDLPTAQAQLAEWRRIARKRCRELGIAESLIAPVYGFDGEGAGSFDGMGQTLVGATPTGAKAAVAGTSILGGVGILALIAKAVLA